MPLSVCINQMFASNMHKKTPRGACMISCLTAPDTGIVCVGI